VVSTITTISWRAYQSKVLIIIVGYGERSRIADGDVSWQLPTPLKAAPTALAVKAGYHIHVEVRERNGVNN
jgi:hypothetical protein